MGKSPEAAIFLPKAPVLPAASRAYTLDGGEAYEKQQHRKPLLHESGGVRRDRPAAAGDRRGGRRRRGLRRAPQAQAPEPDILTLEILAAPEPIVPPELQPEAEPEPASEPEPEPTYTPPVFSAEEADGIRIAGACSYTPDKQTLLLQPSSLDFQQDGRPS